MPFNRSNRTARNYPWLGGGYNLVGSNFPAFAVSSSSFSTSSSSSSSSLSSLSSSSSSVQYSSSSSSSISSESSSSSIDSSSSISLGDVDSSSSSSSSSFLDLTTYRVTGCDTVAANGDYVQDEGFWYIGPGFFGWFNAGARYRYRQTGTNYYITTYLDDGNWQIVENPSGGTMNQKSTVLDAGATPPLVGWSNNAVLTLLSK